MLKKIGNFMVDENDNKWSLARYNKDQIKRYAKKSKSNLGCINCVNCTDCVDCIDCRNCVNCTDCTGCDDCERCHNCKSCDECTGCYSCNNCDDCNNCNTCTDCECCDFSHDMDECINCYECSNCNKCVDCDTSIFIKNMEGAYGFDNSTKTLTDNIEITVKTKTGAVTEIFRFTPVKTKDGKFCMGNQKNFDSIIESVKNGNTAEIKGI